ncbi:MAG: prepilin-type N-terminal cleavage/methylation domain-containing protein [Candidatus Avelusimicrobium sp.]
MQKNKKGFTLLELLVVVLIIGILSAVALPQYQKAVAKSRATQLYSAINGLHKGVQSYFLENGSWPENFDVLDIDFPLPSQSGTACSLAVGRGNTLKKGKDYALVIGKSALWNDLFAVFTQGPYPCTGFAYIKSEITAGDELFCVEPARRSNYAKGDFCTKVMGFTFERNYHDFEYFR